MKNTTNNFNVFVTKEFSNACAKNSKPTIEKIGDGYSVISYWVPANMRPCRAIGCTVSNIIKPNGDMVFPEWVLGHINSMHTIEEQNGWIYVSHEVGEEYAPGCFISKTYVNYVNVNGEFLLDKWLKNGSVCSYPFKNGFAQIYYKERRHKLFPDGTIERWNANTKKIPTNHCVDIELKAIKKHFGNIGHAFKVENGVISFIINREDYIKQGGNPLSKFFCVRDAHSWNCGFSTDWKISDECRIIISRPPRFNGNLCLSIKKSKAWANLEVRTPFANIEEVINAIDGRLVPTFNTKQYSVDGNWISKR